MATQEAKFCYSIHSSSHVPPLAHISCSMMRERPWVCPEHPSATHSAAAPWTNSAHDQMEN